MGHDEILDEILKWTSQIIELYLMDIFNICIEQKVFRESFKLAKVIPLTKKDDMNNQENHRPTNLLALSVRLMKQSLVDG